MKQLEPLLDGDALTATGASVRENIRGAAVRDPEVIRPLDRPFSDKPPIVVLRGSLAPESAIVKLGVRNDDRRAQFSGPAIVYDDGTEAMRAIEKGQVRPGHVLVVRGMGPKGGPGMAGPASMVVFAIDSAGLQNEVAFVSDGQLSGLCNRGLTVAEVSPESAVGGPLSLVENGDRIVIDVDQQRLDLDVPEAELAARRARRGPPRLPRASGYLSIYQRSVQPMSTGAVLVKRE
jgi:dihydroxy-acid dehydratase